MDGGQASSSTPAINSGTHTSSGHASSRWSMGAALDAVTRYPIVWLR